MTLQNASSCQFFFKQGPSTINKPLAMYKEKIIRQSIFISFKTKNMVETLCEVDEDVLEGIVFSEAQWSYLNNCNPSLSKYKSLHLWSSASYFLNHSSVQYFMSKKPT